MGAPQQILLAGGINRTPVQTLVVGNGGSVQGFSSDPSLGTFGSLTGGGLAAPQIALIASGARDLIMRSSGTVLQNAFKDIYIQDGTGTVRVYTSASAVYAPSGSNTQWAWGTGSSPVYVFANVGLSRTVQFD